MEPCPFRAMPSAAGIFFQHAGFHYVVAEAPLSAAGVALCKSDQLVSEYAEFYYGDVYFVMPNFPRAIAQLAVEAMGEQGACAIPWSKRANLWPARGRRWLSSD